MSRVIKLSNSKGHYSSFTSTLRYFRTQSVTYVLYAPSFRAKMPRFEAKSKHAE